MSYIRQANINDVEGIIRLLHQVNMVHHRLRPDLFKPNTTKYGKHELEDLINDPCKPIFVYVEEEVLGYAFCQVTETNDNLLLQDIKTLYIDDICVDEKVRGRHIGRSLFEHVRHYARAIDCRNITLNVWEGNSPAMTFYHNMGMHVMKTTMEIIL